MTAESVQPQPSTPIEESRGWWRFRSSCLVIIICLAIGVTCAILFYRNSTSHTVTDIELRRLSAPPVIMAIVGIDASDFWQADPFVLATDGTIYGRTWGLNAYSRDAYSWAPATPVGELTDGTSCNGTQWESIEVMAGRLVDCRTVETQGEFCPGPIVSFGLAADGYLWEMTQDQPCRVSLYIGLLLFVPIGLVLGLLLVLLNQLRLAIMRRRRPA